MSKEFMSRLFWACSDEEGHMADGLNLGELYERDGEAETAGYAFLDAVDALDKKTADKLTELYNEAVRAYEKQGLRDNR